MEAAQHVELSLEEISAASAKTTPKAPASRLYFGGASVINKASSAVVTQMKLRPAESRYCSSRGFESQMHRHNVCLNRPSESNFFLDQDNFESDPRLH